MSCTMDPVWTPYGTRMDLLWTRPRQIVGPTITNILGSTVQCVLDVIDVPVNLRQQSPSVTIADNREFKSSIQYSLTDSVTVFTEFGSQSTHPKPPSSCKYILMYRNRNRFCMVLCAVTSSSCISCACASLLNFLEQERCFYAAAA